MIKIPSLYLSANDWVHTPDKGYFKLNEKQASEISGIVKVEPIRVTVEMLMLNEWVYSPAYNEWSFGKILIIEDDNDLILYDTSLGVLAAIRRVCVHQLQRALRMSGYKEAANNFKIE